MNKKNKIVIDFQKNDNKYKKLVDYKERPEIQEVMDEVEDDILNDDDEIKEIQEDIDLKIEQLSKKIEKKKKDIKLYKQKKQINDKKDCKDIDSVIEDSIINSQIPPNNPSLLIDIPLKLNEAINIKSCPKCNKKLKREKVKHLDNIFYQSFVCKNKKCDYRREIAFRF
jgi:hypothetical protein